MKHTVSGVTRCIFNYILVTKQPEYEQHRSSINSAHNGYITTVNKDVLQVHFLSCLLLHGIYLSVPFPLSGFSLSLSLSLCITHYFCSLGQRNMYRALLISQLVIGAILS